VSEKQLYWTTFNVISISKTDKLLRLIEKMEEITESSASSLDANELLETIGDQYPELQKEANKLIDKFL
jgi:hypothetical protein